MRGTTLFEIVIKKKGLHAYDDSDSALLVRMLPSPLYITPPPPQGLFPRLSSPAPDYLPLNILQ